MIHESISQENKIIYDWCCHTFLSQCVDCLLISSVLDNGKHHHQQR